MSKYIKSFENASDMQNYIETAPGKAYYLFKDNSGEEGIGTELTSGKKIISYYKPQHDYLTFTAVDAGATVMHNAVTNTTAEYSTDGGNTWRDAVGVTVTLANVGDKVKYRGVISGDISISSARFTLNSSKKVAASGSIMSMYNNNPDDTTITYTGAFSWMFGSCKSLTTAPELPATTLASSCYQQMFQGCTSLTQAPELPATTLAGSCYQQMFQGCTSLTQAPELPATILTTNCYNYMFQNCSSLTQAPELPATILTTNCYNYMFDGCTSLTTAPELPAINLAQACYYYMFSRCTSLTSAPELPATTLATSCYNYMFNGCTSLTSVTHHITSWSTSSAKNWLTGVAATGTVTCPADSTIPSDSVSGIPTGWTRVDL